MHAMHLCTKPLPIVDSPKVHFFYCRDPKCRYQFQITSFFPSLIYSHSFSSIIPIQLLGLLAVLSLTVYHRNIYFNWVSLTVFVVACSTTWCIEEVLTRSLFGKLVPSTCQSYAEGKILTPLDLGLCENLLHSFLYKNQ